MDRIKRTSIVHIDGRVLARNLLIALGPWYDLACDVVVITIRYYPADADKEKI